MKVFFNEDSSHFFGLMHSNSINATKQTAKDCIYTFKNTDATDFATNINATVSTYDSKIFESHSDKYLKTEEDGKPVNFKDSFVKAVYDIYRVYGYDIIEAWIKALREIGIRPWLSVRMNDAHCLLEEPNSVKSEYFEKHPEHWRITENQADGYFDISFNIRLMFFLLIIIIILIFLLKYFTLRVICDIIYVYVLLEDCNEKAMYI